MSVPLTTEDVIRTALTPFQAMCAAATMASLLMMITPPVFPTPSVKTVSASVWKDSIIKQKAVALTVLVRSPLCMKIYKKTHQFTNVVVINLARVLSFYSHQ